MSGGEKKVTWIYRYIYVVKQIFSSTFKHRVFWYINSWNLLSPLTSKFCDIVAA